MGGILSELFGNDSQTVDVRNDTGPGDHRPFAFRESFRRVRDSPTHKKMRDGTHVQRLELAALVKSSTPEMIAKWSDSVNNFLLKVFESGAIKVLRDERVSVQNPAFEI